MIFQLLRVKQWYKNLLVFLPLIFSGNLFNLNLLLVSFFGFIALCLVSSSQYILNDIIDKKKDQLHPEKRFRPIASKKISVFVALVLSFILFFTGILVAFKLNLLFGLIVVVLFQISLIYSLWLKNEVIADILTISVNFVLRAISGAFLINVSISPWLVLGVFFLAFFLVSGKRFGEVAFLKDKASKIRKTLTSYSKDLTYALMLISTSLLVMCYALYCFFSQHIGLFITLPFALYTIFRYFSLVLKGSKIARNPETAVKDWKLFMSAFVWAALTAIIIYEKVLFGLF